MNTTATPQLSELSPEKLDLLIRRLRREKEKGAHGGIPRRGRGENRFPLSSAQRRLWFFDRLAPGSPLYNVAAAARLEGTLDSQGLARALGEVVRRHEALRTIFVDGGPEPVQVVQPWREVPLPAVDLGSLDPQRREDEEERLARAEARRPFDLARGPLLRATLLRRGPADHVLVLVLHHIVCDGWSMGILVRELADLYEAFAAGRPSPLPELPIQYADFAVWQDERLARGELDSQLAYWRGQLADAPVLALATDRPRPAVPSFRGARRPVALPPPLARELKRLAGTAGATLFHVLLAGSAALLSRLTGQDDLIVGSPVAGRNRHEIEELIGFFVNTLALRIDLSGDPAFAALLERARRTAIAADTHQDLPFEKVVEATAPERGSGGSPLVQALLDLQYAPAARQLPGLRLEVAELEHGTAKLDLVLSLREEGEGIAGWIEHAVDLFDGPTVERMLGQLRTLLEGAVVDPGRPVALLPLLSGWESQQVLREWNDTASQYPRERSIAELFAAQARARPGEPAVLCGGASLTYGELDRRANRLAGYLRRLGVGPETLVAFALEPSPAMVVAVLGILKAGGAYAPLDLAYPAERLALMLEDLAAPVLITEEALAGALPESAARRVLLLDREAAAIERENAEAPPEPGAGPENLAYVMFTSGSTGRPKGVAVTHRGVVRLVCGSGFATFGPGEVFLQLAPLSFDPSALEIWGSLLHGGALAVPGSRMAALSGLGELIARHWVTSLWLAAGLFREVVEGDLESLRPLRQLVAGGDALSPSHVERVLRELPGLRLVNGYGPTENSTFSTCCRLDGDPWPGPTVPIGRPIANSRAVVLDGSFEPVPAGVVGELFVGGDGLARGYLKRPELTAERFLPDPLASEPGQRLYRTGDLVRLLGDGRLEFLGRRDGQVKVRGFRVELGEIEAALARCSSVRDAVVVVVGEGAAEKRLAAYFVPQAGAVPAPAELRRQLATSLPEFMVPSLWVALESLPLTAHGKVDRRALPVPGRVAPEETFTAPRTPVEEILAGVFADVLGLEQVGVQDDFFALGGHSLLAAQVVSRLRQVLNIEVPLRTFFEAPTPALLARVVETALRSGHATAAPAIEPVPREGPLPLSFAQQRLWFLDRMEPGSPLYNVPVALRLSGRLEPAVLGRVLGEIVRRHEALRTTFGTGESGEPFQTVSPWSPPALPVVDLSALPGPAAGPEERRLAAAEARRPFDLARGPLLRAVLLRREADEHLALVTLHHIVSDGWSMTVLRREMAALYEAFAAGAPSPLPELPIQYADFSRWQREWLRGEVLEAQLSYWRERLAGALEPLELPTDRPRPAARARRGGTRPAALDEPLAAALEGLARREGVTLFMALLAAFGALLSRLGGRRAVSVGVPVANRNRAEVEGLIGFFANTLVMRIELASGRHCSSLLGRVREAALGAYAHQDLPFEKLVEELQPERSLGNTPLFQVAFAFQGAVEEDTAVGGLRLDPAGIHPGTAKFDLTLALSRRGGRLEGTLEYDRDLFDAATAERLLGHLRSLLEGAVTDPRMPVALLPLLSGAERHQLLLEWSGGAAAWPRGHTLHGLFERQARLRPDAVAVVCGEESLSYDALDQRANRLARHLRRLGAGPETLVALAVERSVEMVVAILGSLKAGAAYVPLDPAYPAERLSLMLEDLRAEVLLTVERLAGALSASGARVVLLDGLPEDGSAEAAPAPEPGAGPDNAAYVIYTSGSTGRPKGVVVTHDNATRLFAATRDWFAFSESDVWTLFHSYAFDFSVWEIWGALLHGGRLVVVPQWTARSADAFYQMLRSERVTVLNQTPSAFRQLLRVEEWLGGVAGGLHLRWIVFGGEALDPRSLQPWFDRHGDRSPVLVNMYGITETTVHVTYRPIGTGDLGAGSVIGVPIPDLRVFVLDESLLPLPAGAPGELYVGGAGLARGYLRKPELTAQRFVPNPYGGPGDRLYRTGDLARWRPDGELEYLGRIDHQVKIRGFRVELGEVEAVLGQHEAVRECAVLVCSEDPDDRRLAAYVVCRGGSLPGPDELRAFLTARLPEYMVPAVFVPLEALPLTPTGKLDRRALPPPEAVRPGPQQASATPRTPVEEILAGIFADVLGLERAGAGDDFFALGGHSLLATQVVSRLRQALNVEVPLRTLFEAPTPAALARVVEAALRSGSGPAAPAIAPAPRGRPLPLSFAQQRLWFLDQLDPGNPAYNMPSAVRLAGPLDRGALERSLAEVVRRHEILRTGFEAGAEGPVQVIAPAASVPLPRVDLAGLPSEARAAESVALCASLARLPFDLTRPPLLRAFLLRLAADEHVVHLTLHHVVGDGWSTGVLVRELAVLYDSFRAGRPSPLPELRVQYADFACWQREWLAGEPLDAHREYWTRRLSGELPELALPYDRPRRTLRGYRGAQREVRLPAELSGRLRALGRRRGATLFMTLLAGLAALLGRITGQRDILVGTDVANRNRLDTEGLIGFFINILLLRADLSGDPTFEELLARMREVALGAYAHQDMPFDRLVEELQPERGLSPTPLFQVLLVLENVPIAPPRLDGLELTVLPVDSGTSKFDLALVLHDQGEEIAGSWIYSAELFDPPTIERLARRFEVLLDDASRRPDARLSSLEMLTASERTERDMEKIERQTPGIRGLRNARRQPAVPGEDSLVTTSTLQPGEPLPLVVRPAVADVDLAGWARANLETLEEKLARHGAILFRGFALAGIADFERLAGAVCGELFGEYGDLPREGLGGRVYSSTPYPADKAILFHNESSQMDQWPLKQWFFCVTPARKGGETPVADCRRVCRLLDPALRERFRQAGVMYVRNFTEGLDVSWQEFFRTTDRAVVEEACRRAGLDLEWRSDGGLRTRKRAPAVAVHPKTGEEVFFNQIQAHHISCLDPEVRNSLLSLFGEENLPRNVLYGDGRPIEDEIMAEVRAVYDQVAVTFPWQQGDVLLVDNMLTAHSRNPFEGPRKIVVAMGEMFRNPLV